MQYLELTFSKILHLLFRPILLQTFLAQKYGYRPFPPKIAADEFETLLSAVSDAGDRDLLSDWFIQDKNVVPPIYMLHPIRVKLPHYADDSQPEKKKEVPVKFCLKTSSEVFHQRPRDGVRFWGGGGGSTPWIGLGRGILLN